MAEVLKTSQEKDNTSTANSWGELGKDVDFNAQKATELQKNHRKAETQRERIDRLKTEIRNEIQDDPFKMLSYERQKVAAPSKVELARRKVLDAFHIKSEKVEKQRDLESIPNAIAEIKSEQKAARDENSFNSAMERAESDLKWTVRDILNDEEQQKREQEQVIQTMAFERKNIKSKKYEGQRSQEILERELNGKLTKVEDIDLYAEAGDAGVSKRQLEYQGQNITVYDLKGLPFAILPHAIDYKRLNWKDKSPLTAIGRNTSKALLNDPSIWNIREDKVQFDLDSENAKGNVISASYANSDTNLRSFVYTDNEFKDNYTIYGFEKVEGDSILDVHLQDGATANFWKDKDSAINKHDINALTQMERRSVSYNEIVLRRYSETGIPKKPDYMVTVDGNTPEATLKHAAYHNIPIINIEMKYYEDQQTEKANELLDALDENSNYEDLVDTLSFVGGMLNYSDARNLAENIGLGTEDEYILANYADSKDEVKQKIIPLYHLEWQKRMDYLANKLESEIAKIKQYTKDGTRYNKLESGIYATQHDGSKGLSQIAFPELNLSCELPGVGYFTTNIFDSRREALHVNEGYESEADEYYANRTKNASKWSSQPSSEYYDKLKPLVDAYEAAVEENYLA